jgi:hypothetical protein
MALSKMKMLQKMRLLEEQGAAFAQTPIKDLQVFGECVTHARSTAAAVKRAGKAEP